MKKNKLALYAVALATVVLSSCGGLNKMKESSKNLSYSLTPSPLEVKGGQVEVTVQGTFPPKFFNTKAVLIATPVIKYKGGEVALKPFTVQGENVQGNDKVIKYAEGGSYTTTDKIPYKKDYELSEVEVRVKATLGKESDDFLPVKVGDGVIATEYLVVKDPRPVIATSEYIRQTTEKLGTEIKYLINKSDVRPSEIKKEDVVKFDEALKSIDTDPKKEISAIQLSAYASPDGPMKLNEKLSVDRKESANKYFTTTFKKEKLTKVKDELFTYLTTAEDWDGFKTLVENSTIKDKELILRVLSMYSDPDVREKEIKNISEAFEELKVKVLPELRRSKLNVSITVNGKSDQELLTLAQTKPDSLNLDEALFVATKIDDLNAKLAVYQAAVKKYPNDFKANNNVGYVLYKLNRLPEAKAAFEAAKAIENNSIIKNNLGAIALTEGDVDKAQELFTSALGAGEEVNYNLGIINIIKGKYPEAINYFGNTFEVNTALAKLLNKANDQALSTLNGIKSEDAIVYYLRAIVGARTQNTDLLFTNLRAAAGKSADLKANAAVDLEFAKYFQDPTFKSIIQ